MELSTVRAFVAIELPEDVRVALSAFQAGFEERGSEVRWVPVGNIHLTLKFLGEVAKDRLPALFAGVDEAVFGFEALALKVRETGGFPNLSRPRVLWAGVEDGSGSLEEIAARLEKVLEEIDFPPERRRYHAHLTLARVASQKKVGSFLGEFRGSEFGPIEFTASEIVVMQSELLPEGARYHKLHAAPFGAAGE